MGSAMRGVFFVVGSAVVIDVGSWSGGRLGAFGSSDL
jgi:hypothetical protein